MPSVVHLVPPVAVGHVIVSHAPVAHWRSHSQASRQLMSLHEPEPEQLIVQCEPLAQLTSLHAPVPMQLIMHVHPFGQSTVLQSSSDEQFIVHIFASSSQPSQSDGQFGSTQ
jgi:hypothetical protein